MVDNGFTKYPLGRLAPIDSDDMTFMAPRNEVLTDTSEERKRLLEDYRSGYIDLAELREELQALKDG